MKQHPEQRDGELYMGNTMPAGFYESAWHTKRMGRVAMRSVGS